MLGWLGAQRLFYERCDALAKTGESPAAKRAAIEALVAQTLRAARNSEQTNQILRDAAFYLRNLAIEIANERKAFTEAQDLVEAAGKLAARMAPLDKELLSKLAEDRVVLGRNKTARGEQRWAGVKEYSGCIFWIGLIGFLSLVSQCNKQGSTTASAPSRSKSGQFDPDRYVSDSSTPYVLPSRATPRRYSYVPPLPPTPVRAPAWDDLLAAESATPAPRTRTRTFDEIFAPTPMPVATPLAARTPRVATPIPFSPPPLALLQTGAGQRYFESKSGIVPLRINTPAGGGHYWVKVLDLASGRTVMEFFIREGESVTVKLPLGTCRLRYAWGREWFGRKLLFGPQTRAAEADETLTFSRQGNRVSGHELTLTKQVGGNLSETAVTPANF